MIPPPLRGALGYSVKISDRKLLVLDEESNSGLPDYDACSLVSLRRSRIVFCSHVRLRTVY
jgi:hypothetical protein